MPNFIESFRDTVDTRYLDCPFSRTFTISNFFFGPFSISSNFPYNYSRYLEPRYLELSLCRTNFSVPSALLSRYLERFHRFLKKISSKTLRFDCMFILLCSFIIIRTFFFYIQQKHNVCQAKA